MLYQWESKYGTKSYAVDVKEGYIYAVRNEDWERLVERAYVATDEPLEIEQTTPVEKETLVGEVQTLNSKEKVPLAESTRKDFKEPIKKGKGVPGADFLDSELDLESLKKNWKHQKESYLLGTQQMMSN